MNPFWFVTRAAGIALITIGGTSLLIKKLAPKPSNIMAGAMHFGRGLDEFRKGCNAMIFGVDTAAAGKTKESTKIPID
jgi:hypothetical protein